MALTDLRFSIRAADESAAAFASVRREVTEFGRQTQLSAFGTQNLSFQVNDLAQQLATGASPFRTLIQQGSQIVQLFGPGVGVGAALKQVGASIGSFLLNPLNLAVIGFAVATEAAFRLFGAISDDGEKAKKTLDVHKQLIADIRDLLGEAAEEATNFRAKLPETLGFRTKDAIAAAAAELQSELNRIVGAMDLFGRDDPLGDRIGALGAMIDTFAAQVAAGKGDIIAFQEAIARLARLDPANEELQALIALLKGMSAAAIEATEKLTNLRGAADLLAGRHLDEYGLRRGTVAARGEDTAEETFFPTQGKGKSIAESFADFARERGSLSSQIDTIDTTFKKLAEGWDTFRDSVKGTFTDMAEGLIKGTSLAETFGNVLLKIGSAFLNAGIDRIVAAFLGPKGSAGGGLFGSLVSGAGSLLGFAGGGSVMVGGSGGPDSQIFAARVSPGERIDFTPRGGGGGGSPRVMIVPSPYFDVVVDERAEKVAAPLAASISRRSIAATMTARDRRSETHG